MGAMLESRLNVCCDTYHPGFSDNLIDSVISYINSKLDYEQRTEEFINEVHRRLYFIHEYNCQVAQRTCMYPRSRKLEQLLVKYVELEFEFLYYNRHSKEVEVITELRILRLVQVMLCKTVLNDQSLINGNSEAILKKTVLDLFSQVKSTYLTENKLICNVINCSKLLKNVCSTNGRIDDSIFESLDIHKSLATSDYGTDEDSDYENDAFATISHESKYNKESTLLFTSDSMEVPLTLNGGLTTVPIIELANDNDDDDDDDDYMVYLQKNVSENKFHTRLGEYRKQVLLNNDETSNTLKNINNITKNLQKSSDNVSSDCVVVCCDSDDDTSLNKYTTAVKKTNTSRPAAKNQQQGVVTFEIIDDEEDDETELNYMVYLQKEVKTNKKSKKRVSKSLRKYAVSRAVEAIVISDSEDDAVIEMIEENNENRLPQDNQPNERVFEESTLDRSKKLENLTDDSLSKSNKNENDSKIISLNNINTEFGQQEACQETTNEFFINRTEVNTTFSETIPHENMNITFEHEIDLNTCKNSSLNFLVDPAAIFENISSIELPGPGKDNNPCSVIHNENIPNKSIEPFFEELTSEKPDTLGGPVLSEKMDDLDGLENSLECRLNDSLLEEILLNDSYLLECHKEFEELECFLFDDKNEAAFNTTDFSCDKDEMEFLNEDLKSSESLLTDIQTLPKDDDQWLFQVKKDVKNCKFKRKRRKHVLNLHNHRKSRARAISKCNPLKDFTNNNHQHEENTLKEYYDLRLAIEPNYTLKRENSCKTTFRRKISIVNRR